MHVPLLSWVDRPKTVYKIGHQTNAISPRWPMRPVNSYGILESIC